MRILDLTTHVQNIRRSPTLDNPDGETATAAAAYRACTVIRCERTGMLYDYRRKYGLVAAGIEAPADAPAWARDRGQLWNAAELRERNKGRGPNKLAFKADAVVAREFMFGFPAELSPEGRRTVAHAAALYLVERYRVAADYAIHAPGRDSDQRNFHCHILTTSRRMGPDGLGAKIRELDDRDKGSRNLKMFRADLARMLNEALAAEGKAGEVHVEHRSFKDRGSSAKPTRHQGKAKTRAAREASREKRETWHAQEQAAMTDRQANERTAFETQQAAARAAQERDHAARQAQAARSIDAEQERSAGPEKPSGLVARIADRLRRDRADQTRAVQAAERVRASEARIAELTAAIDAERRSLAAAQRAEAKALGDRQQGEAQGLEKALAARFALDRAAESQARREEVRQQEQQRTQQQEHDHARHR